MIWWQSELKSGDLIRINLGSFYHYGIFVSEDEVIQFGLPPVNGLLNRDASSIEVIATSIDVFSAGHDVEVAKLEKSDKLKRLSPEKTVKLARGAIGQKGYDILHNNCEHFAKKCYYGKQNNDFENSSLNSYKNMPVLDVYFSVFDNVLPYTVYPKKRNKEILSVKNELVKKSKFWAWKTLEYALFRTFSLKIQNLKFKKNKYGKWECKNCYFSISHSHNLVMVAVSNRNVGVDIENFTLFKHKFEDSKTFNALSNRILNDSEESPKNHLELAELWTKKESLYKFHGTGIFNPKQLSTISGGKSFSITYNDIEYVGSIFDENNCNNIRFYYFDGEKSEKFGDVKWILD